MVTYNNSKVIEVINKIKQNNLNSTEFYEITFTEDLNIIGKDIDLGGKTYKYIKINAPLTNYEEGRKEITTNIFDRDGVEKIEIDGEEKNMVKFDFDVINYVFDGTNDVPSGMNDVSFDIFVSEDDADALETYISQTTFKIEDVDSGIEDAIDDGEGFNATGAACNICIRATLHYIANDNVLFPYKLASQIGGSGTTSYKGKISGVGRANNIFVELAKWRNSSIYSLLNNYEDKLKEDDFNEWVSWDTTETVQQSRINLGENHIVNSTVDITEFEHIAKDVTITIGNQNYQIPNFNDLQKQANAGVLIIGVRKNTDTYTSGNYKSGHIVIISPYTEGSVNEEGRKVYDATTGVKIYFPRTVECGKDDKVLGWLSDYFAKDMEWYRYK